MKVMIKVWKLFCTTFANVMMYQRNIIFIIKQQICLINFYSSCHYNIILYTIMPFFLAINATEKINVKTNMRWTSERRKWMLLLELTECSPVETWESSIILYARSERSKIAGRWDEKDGKLIAQKRFPELGKTLGVRLLSSNLLYPHFAPAGIHGMLRT